LLPSNNKTSKTNHGEALGETLGVRVGEGVGETVGLVIGVGVRATVGLVAEDVVGGSWASFWGSRG
jgi:hypothetical protein